MNTDANHETKEIGGVMYERWGYPPEEPIAERIWRPVEYGTHPYICNCGSITFKITNPGSYETDARCTICGHTETVHSG